MIRIYMAEYKLFDRMVPWDQFANGPFMLAESIVRGPA